MKRAKVRIDKEHTLRLMAGKPIAIKVPEGADVIQLELAQVAGAAPDSWAKLCDVFFNGRPA